MPVISVKAAIEIMDMALPEPITQQLGVDEIVYSGLIEISTGATHTVNFGVITTATFVYIKVNNDVTYTFNGGSETFNLGVGGGIQGGFVIMFNTSITALAVIDTSGGSNAEVIIAGT